MTVAVIPQPVSMRRSSRFRLPEPPSFDEGWGRIALWIGSLGISIGGHFALGWSIQQVVNAGITLSSML